MIIPSIDIQGGETVQLVGGKKRALSAGDPIPLAQKFGRVGEIAVIDLDAALSTGSNASQIRELCKVARCRVGGGIRDLDTAIDWLDAGAAKIILGTAARPELLSQLPKERVIAALDAVHQADGTGEVVDEGWTRSTGAGVLEKIEQLRPYVSGFLITFVEREGRLTGIDVPTIKSYIAAAAGAKVTIAGGVATAEEIATVDELGADAQIGMALYTGRMSLAGGFCSMLNSDRADGLWPTVVTNPHGQMLGLVYSNVESVDRSLETGDAHYWSRKRGLWRKGESSGNVQKLISIDADCDRDSLRFTVHQSGSGFCHLPQPTCFGNLHGITELQQTLMDRLETAPPDSYTRRLFESPGLLAAKIREEADELVEANTRDEVVHEAADLVYFALTRLVKEKVDWIEIEKELDRRSLKISRRGGDAKVSIDSKET